MLGLVDIDESQIRLMHERRRLQRLTGVLTSHSRRSQFSQLIVDHRQQLLGRF
jgi:hypothetical protein